jgi:hypothetical protein
VPPGDFVLGVNIDEPPTESKYLHSPYPPTYYPGVTDRAAAKVIHVGSAQQLTGFNLKLPSRLKQRMFWGSVVLASGKPAFGAYVELKDSEFPDWNADLGYADRNGSFLVYGVEGREYRLVGSTGIGKGEAPMHSEVVRIKTGASAPIRLMLSFPGKP